MRRFFPSLTGAPAFFALSVTILSGALCLRAEETPAPAMHLRLAASTAATAPVTTTAASPAAAALSSATAAAEADTALPDAPAPVNAQQNLPAPRRAQSTQPVVDDGVRRSRYRNVIDPGEPVPSLGVSGKLILSVRESVAPFTIVATVAAAGINHLDQGDPQYGEGDEAFGKRVGAAFALEASGNIFSDGILASAFHEDPRYYREPDAPFLNRAFHPIESVFITRTDGGHKTPNFSSLIGLAGASFLTQVYYPESSANNRTSLNTYGYSLAGLAAANLVSEFVPDIWHKIHHPSD